MRPILPLVMLSLALSACADLQSRVSATAARFDQAANPDRPLPGLAPLGQKPQSPPVIAATAQPEPPSPDDFPFPPRLIGEDEARAVLAGDPAALRFLTMRRLADLGLVAPADAGARAEANMGALLPLTRAQAPAAGITTPIPPPAVVEKAMRDLWSHPGTRDQRDFLVDGLLPLAPQSRQKLDIADKQSARQALARLDRLSDSGLIDHSQAEAERAATQALIDGNALPETLVVVPPPEPVVPEAPKKPKRTGSGKPMERLQGGVSGELKVIASPPEINAPALPANFTGPAGIHLLSMGSASHGERAWKTLTTQHPDLAALTYKVVRVDLGELGVTYRLIAGPLTAAKAGELCEQLKPKGEMCRPTPFPADAIKP